MTAEDSDIDEDDIYEYAFSFLVVFPLK